MLIKKFVLVALMSGHRAQSIHDMDLEHSVTVPKYTANSALCAYSALTDYIQKTAEKQKPSNYISAS